MATDSKRKEFDAEGNPLREAEGSVQSGQKIEFRPFQNQKDSRPQEHLLNQTKEQIDEARKAAGLEGNGVDQTQASLEGDQASNLMSRADLHKKNLNILLDSVELSKKRTSDGGIEADSSSDLMESLLK